MANAAKKVGIGHLASPNFIVETLTPCRFSFLNPEEVPLAGIQATHLSTRLLPVDIESTRRGLPVETSGRRNECGRSGAHLLLPEESGRFGWRACIAHR